MCSGIRSSRIGTVCSISGWTPPDMVVTIMCCQRVAIAKIRCKGVFPLNSHVLRDQELKNRHRLLDICEAPPNVVVMTMCP